MNLNEIVKKRRIELGLTINEAAEKSGLSIHEYTDVEDYPDEIASVLQLRDLKSICKTLNIDIYEFLGNETECAERDQGDKADLVSLNELVRQKRETANLTRIELGDRLGFYEEAIIDMESDPKFLESWSIELIKNLCAELKIPITVIIKKLER
jgi:transcriptional regulator with XRE-family HTH domain